MKNGQIEVKELKARPVAFVSFTGNYMGNVQVFSDLFVLFYFHAPYFTVICIQIIHLKLLKYRNHAPISHKITSLAA